MLQRTLGISLPNPRQRWMEFSVFPICIHNVLPASEENLHMLDKNEILDMEPSSHQGRVF